MNESGDILEQLERELVQAEQRVQELESAIKVVRELRKNGGATGQEEGGPYADDDLSISDAAVKVLQDQDRPMSAREVARKLLAGGFPYDKDEDALKSSVLAALGRRARSGNGVARPETGKYVAD